MHTRETKKDKKESFFSRLFHYINPPASSSNSYVCSGDVCSRVPTVPAATINSQNFFSQTPLMSHFEEEAHKYSNATLSADIVSQEGYLSIASEKLSDLYNDPAGFYSLLLILSDEVITQAGIALNYHPDTLFSIIQSYRALALFKLAEAMPHETVGISIASFLLAKSLGRYMKEENANLLTSAVTIFGIMAYVGVGNVALGVSVGLGIKGIAKSGLFAVKSFGNKVANMLELNVSPRISNH